MLERFWGSVVIQQRFCLRFAIDTEVTFAYYSRLSGVQRGEWRAGLPYFLVRRGKPGVARSRLIGLE